MGGDQTAHFRTFISKKVALSAGFLAVINLALSACTAPAPIVEYRTITPTLPPALLAQQPPPDVPECTTQSCIAQFIVDDREWGAAGWAQVAAIGEALTPPAAKK